jgi:hypothetical protein
MVGGPSETRKTPGFPSTQPYAGLVYDRGTTPLSQHASTVLTALSIEIMRRARTVNPDLRSHLITISTRDGERQHPTGSRIWMIELRPMTIARQPVEIKDRLLEAIGQKAIEEMLREMTELMGSNGISATAAQHQQLPDAVSLRLTEYRL